jgi:hypothetical protein
MDHRSFRDQLAFRSASRSPVARDLLRRLLKEHVTDDARQMLADRVREPDVRSFDDHDRR